MGKKILIIDDQPDILDVLTEVIEILGHEAVSVCSGKSIGSKVDLNDFDLVISDYQMPDMTGVEIAKKIKAECPEMKVFIISGYHQILSEKKMEEYGVSGILNKPFDIEELKRVING
ncbi:MAG: response regulator [Candidatus Delongbacteria bacterium]